MTFKELKKAGILRHGQHVRLLIATQFAGLYAPTEPIAWYKIVSTDAFDSKIVTYIIPVSDEELEIRLDDGEYQL